MRKSISILSISLALMAISFTSSADGVCENVPLGIDGACVELMPTGPLSGGDYYCDIVLPYSYTDCKGLPTFL